jgi:hypothetical protein
MNDEGRPRDRVYEIKNARVVANNSTPSLIHLKISKIGGTHFKIGKNSDRRLII